jgi:hypothetical protein
MDFKELLFTMIAVALGVLLANFLQAKIPALAGSWEESYETVNS